MLLQYGRIGLISKKKLSDYAMNTLWASINEAYHELRMLHIFGCLKFFKCFSKGHDLFSKKKVYLKLFTGWIINILKGQLPLSFHVLCHACILALSTLQYLKLFSVVFPRYLGWQLPSSQLPPIIYSLFPLASLMPEWPFWIANLIF